MEKHAFRIELHCSKGDAEKKVSAFMVLASKLTASEMEKLAHVVKNDPVKTALAKKALGV